MAACTLTHSHAEGSLAPDQRARIEQIERVMQLEIALAELRDGSRTQKEIDVVQNSTFQRYVEELGGSLEIQVVFDDI